MDVTGSAAVRAQLLLGQACALRAELKNLRQDVNKAVRVHKKSIEDLRTLLHSLKREHIQDDVPIQNDDPNRNQVSLSLEKGSIQTTPIGYIESCFSAKNGTPRQPTVCSLSRARLKISKTIFTNADHSLMGLEQFSHVWIIFIFHKNGHQGYKAKVKPPRLNGLKTGVFSTRSPHRPNAIGLTLGKLDRIEGDTLYLSGIDMIQGTPVLDIKPYIPDYDTPGVDPMDNINDSQEICVTDEQCQGITNPISGVVTEESEDKESAHVKVASKIACDYVTDGVEHSPKDATNPFRKTKGEIVDEEGNVGKMSSHTINKTPKKENYCKYQLRSEKVDQLSGKGSASYESIHLTVEKIKSQLIHSDIVNHITEEDQVICFKPEKSLTVSKRKKTKNVIAINTPWNKLSNGNIATWIKQSPVTSLEVRFTPHAEMDLQQFQAPGGSDPDKITLKYFHSIEEIKSAMVAVLSADPRSIYRRMQCQDMLFYFTLDTAHITTWFGDDFTEILRIKPVKEESDIGTINV
ncbi:tRNA (adenine(37)-N6)-methyltransferase isoform X1 [Pristis pectinata]|uniref:tRNA (adenine(37)-N6)-methyltransferase isoform X1 n=1 Tax=Pristis pectinata TaxID=685728 RepID=UPI00223CBC6E|nr:tRNA (adenine(37)-N6)-methyltransferase isoform X1 [Pristis pectinata]